MTEYLQQCLDAVLAVPVPEGLDVAEKRVTLIVRVEDYNIRVTTFKSTEPDRCHT